MIIAASAIGALLAIIFLIKMFHGPKSAPAPQEVEVDPSEYIKETLGELQEASKVEIDIQDIQKYADENGLTKAEARKLLIEMQNLSRGIDDYNL